MIGKHRFRVGQRVRPSRHGIEALLFTGSYRGINKSEASGLVVAVDKFNSPTVLWSYRRTAASYHPNFISPDRRRL